jgi:intergrase/recombinase
MDFEKVLEYKESELKQSLEELENTINLKNKKEQNKFEEKRNNFINLKKETEIILNDFENIIKLVNEK